MGFERGYDVVGADEDVMVAEDAEALRRFEAREDLGADAGRLPGDAMRQRAAADEVAGDEDEFGLECVDLARPSLRGTRPRCTRPGGCRRSGRCGSRRRRRAGCGWAKVRWVISNSWRAWVPE